MTERNAERRRAERETTGPVGTMFGAAFGPVGAAVGSVVDANRLAFTVQFGTGVPRSTAGDDGLEDAATIEIEDAGAGDEEDEDEVATDDGETEDA